jgi:transcriptional regulator with XRE-family HTH domain
MGALNKLPFGDWLLQEIEKRGLTYSELARRGGTTPARVSQVISGDRPGWDFCLAVARAFDVPAEKIFRLAGHLPPSEGETLPDLEALQAANVVLKLKGKKIYTLPDLDDMVGDFWPIWQDLSNEGRKEILKLAQELLEKQREIEESARMVQPKINEGM